jgi:hypothetical protein
LAIVGPVAVLDLTLVDISPTTDGRAPSPPLSDPPVLSVGGETALYIAEARNLRAMSMPGLPPSPTFYDRQGYLWRDGTLFTLPAAVPKAASYARVTSIALSPDGSLAAYVTSFGEPRDVRYHYALTALDVRTGRVVDLLGTLPVAGFSVNDSEVAATNGAVAFEAHSDITNDYAVAIWMPGESTAHLAPGNRCPRLSWSTDGSMLHCADWLEDGTGFRALDPRTGATVPQVALAHFVLSGTYAWTRGRISFPAYSGPRTVPALYTWDDGLVHPQVKNVAEAAFDPNLKTVLYRPALDFRSFRVAAPLQIRREGRTLLVRAGGRPVIGYDVAVAPDGEAVAFHGEQGSALDALWLARVGRHASSSADRAMTVATTNDTMRNPVAIWKPTSARAAPLFGVMSPMPVVLNTVTLKYAASTLVNGSLNDSGRNRPSIQ